MNVNSLPILNQSLIEFIPKNPEFLIDKQTIYGPYQQNISIIFTYLSNDDEQPPPICYHPNRIKLIGNFFNQKFKLSTTTSNVNHHYNHQNVSITKTILTINNITLDDYGYYQCNNHRFELTGRPKINIENNIEDIDDDDNKIITLNVLSHTPIQSQSIIVCLINKIHQHCQTYLIRPIHLLNDCSQNQNCQIILLINNFHIKHYHRYYHQNKTTIKLSMELTNRFGRTRFTIPSSSSSKTGIIDDEEQHEQQQDQMLIIINDDQIQLRLIIFIIIILMILIISIIGCRRHPYLQQQQQQSDNDDDVTTTTNRINSIQQQPSTSAIMKTTYPDDDDKNKESNHNNNNKDQESRLSSSLSSSL